MKKSKKGVTLVELVICCAIMVMLAGACTAVLVSGQRLYASGSGSANARITADLLQTSLYGKLPGKGSVKVIPVSVAADVTPVKGSSTGTALYFQDGDVLVIQNDGNPMTVNDVTGFTYTFQKVGINDSARTQFHYTATLANGGTCSGGIVSSKLAFQDITLAADTGSTTLSLQNISDPDHPLDLKNHILFFDTADPGIDS